MSDTDMKEDLFLINVSQLESVSQSFISGTVLHLVGLEREKIYHSSLEKESSLSSFFQISRMYFVVFQLLKKRIFRIKAWLINKQV